MLPNIHRNVCGPGGKGAPEPEAGALRLRQRRRLRHSILGAALRSVSLAILLAAILPTAVAVTNPNDTAAMRNVRDYW